jgi:pyruvate,water dikinase
MKLNRKPVNLRGVPASPGIATGPAAIVRSWRDIDGVPDGAVLVATKTEPDMFLVFSRICAVVTDTGGKTSHAAINALSLGLPCVVAAERATSVIRDRDLVTVDGTSGDVTIQKRARAKTKRG